MSKLLIEESYVERRGKRRGDLLIGRMCPEIIKKIKRFIDELFDLATVYKQF